MYAIKYNLHKAYRYDEAIEPVFRILSVRPPLT